MENRLSSEQKSEIAQAITRMHCEVTGAPGYFAQVILNEIKPGNYFMNGAPLRHDQLFVYGRWRYRTALHTCSHEALAIGRQPEYSPAGLPDCQRHADRGLGRSSLSLGLAVSLPGLAIVGWLRLRPGVRFFGCAPRWK